MCGVCIGGFCIPYAAILPMLIIGLQWIASQFAKVGLRLPESIARYLNLHSSGKAQPDVLHVLGCIAGCLCGNRPKKSDPAAKETTSMSDYGEDRKGERWEKCISDDTVATTTVTTMSPPRLMTEESSLLSNKNSTITSIQFPNAEWCMPCNEIQTQ